jgi:hypothetical protein
MSGHTVNVAATGTGASGKTQTGRPPLRDGPRARPTHWPPLRLARLCREHGSVRVVCPLRLPPKVTRGGYMRSIALDIHRDFCQVAIKEGGEVRLRGRIKTGAEELELFARHKLRRLELIAGDPSRRGRRSGSRGVKARAAPRARALRAVRGRLPAARRRLAAEAKRCGCDTGARIVKASRKSQAARQASAPNLRFSSSSPAPRVTLPERRVGVQRT